jgi:hypothetical protein
MNSKNRNRMIARLRFIRQKSYAGSSVATWMSGFLNAVRAEVREFHANNPDADPRGALDGPDYDRLALGGLKGLPSIQAHAAYTASTKGRDIYGPPVAVEMVLSAAARAAETAEAGRDVELERYVRAAIAERRMAQSGETGESATEPATDEVPVEDDEALRLLATTPLWDAAAEEDVRALAAREAEASFNDDSASRAVAPSPGLDGAAGEAETGQDGPWDGSETMPIDSTQALTPPREMAENRHPPPASSTVLPDGPADPLVPSSHDRPPSATGDLAPPGSAPVGTPLQAADDEADGAGGNDGPREETLRPARDLPSQPGGDPAEKGDGGGRDAPLLQVTSWIHAGSRDPSDDAAAPPSNPQIGGVRRGIGAIFRRPISRRLRFALAVSVSVLAFVALMVTGAVIVDRQMADDPVSASATESEISTAVNRVSDPASRDEGKDAGVADRLRELEDAVATWQADAHRLQDEVVAAQSELRDARSLLTQIALERDDLAERLGRTDRARVEAVKRAGRLSEDLALAQARSDSLQADVATLGRRVTELTASLQARAAQEVTAPVAGMRGAALAVGPASPTDPSSAANGPGRSPQVQPLFTARSGDCAVARVEAGETPSQLIAELGVMYDDIVRLNPGLFAPFDRISGTLRRAADQYGPNDPFAGPGDVLVPLLESGPTSLRVRPLNPSERARVVRYPLCRGAR